MRVVLDTNVLISGLTFPESGPGQVLRKWYEGRFRLLACEELFVEIRRVSRSAKLRGRFAFHGRPTGQ
jgi:predicted nucleic acid-binding protein